MAQVVADERLVVRSDPGTGDDSAVLEPRLYQAMRVRVLEGPVAASGYDWLRVRVGRIEGWVAVAGRDGVPWLRPLHNGRIAFLRNHELDARILTVDPDGTAEQVLVEETFPEAAHSGGPATQLALSCGHGVQLPRWSPSGNDLLFASGECTADAIYRVDARDRATRWLTTGGDPEWTPDERTVIFAEKNAGIDARCLDIEAAEIARVDASGGAPARITDNGRCFFGSSPKLSPDGTRIAFTGRREDPRTGRADTALYLVRAGAGGQQRVAEGLLPRWSPDGSQIVFQVIRSSVVTIRIIDADTGRGKVLTTGGGAEWSPDGGSIAFHDRDGIWLISPDGSDRRQLVSEEATEFAWAPDGTALVVPLDPRNVLTIVPIDGGERTSLGVGYHPAWQPRLVP